MFSEAPSLLANFLLQVTTCPVGHTLTTSGSTTVLSSPSVITTQITSQSTITETLFVTEAASTETIATASSPVAAITASSAVAAVAASPSTGSASRAVSTLTLVHSSTITVSQYHTYTAIFSNATSSTTQASSSSVWNIQASYPATNGASSSASAALPLTSETAYAPSINATSSSAPAALPLTSEIAVAAYAPSNATISVPIGTGTGVASSSGSYMVSATPSSSTIVYTGSASKAGAAGLAGVFAIVAFLI